MLRSLLCRYLGHDWMPPKSMHVCARCREQAVLNKYGRGGNRTLDPDWGSRLRSGFLVHAGHLPSVFQRKERGSNPQGREPRLPSKQVPSPTIGLPFREVWATARRLLVEVLDRVESAAMRMNLTMSRARSRPERYHRDPQ